MTGNATGSGRLHQLAGALVFMVTRARFERATPSFGGWCSIQAELPGHWWDVLGSNQ
jgi:hypothetical protein